MRRIGVLMASAEMDRMKIYCHSFRSARKVGVGGFDGAEMLRFRAILLFLIMGPDCGWPEPTAANTRHIRPEDCLIIQDTLSHEAQVFQAFEHPEDSVIEDLGALPKPQQHCSLHKRRRHSGAPRVLRRP